MSIEFDVLLSDIKKLLAPGITDHVSIEWRANVDKSYSLNTTYFNNVYVDKPATVLIVKYRPKTNKFAFPAAALSVLNGNGVKYDIRKDGMLETAPDVFEGETGYVILRDLIYSSYSFDAFGCCGKYKECSKAGKCIHDDLVYATACMYRKNLEAGKIFY